MLQINNSFDLLISKLLSTRRPEVFEYRLKIKAIAYAPYALKTQNQCNQDSPTS